jgi:hypothetical protein
VAGFVTEGPGMISVSGDTPLVTDSDVHALTWEFVNSGYRGDQYANWPIERRLDGFLRRRGLSRHADNGDICNIILDHIMRSMSITAAAAAFDSSG